MNDAETGPVAGDKPKIVFLDRGTVAASADIRRPSFPHDWTEFERSRPDEVVDRCAGAEIVITNKVPISAATLNRLPALRMIAVAATGTDVIDMPGCAARGIVVSNIRS
jgi:glycerate dehydrogenase